MEVVDGGEALRDVADVAGEHDQLPPRQAHELVVKHCVRERGPEVGVRCLETTVEACDRSAEPGVLLLGTVEHVADTVFPEGLPQQEVQVDQQVVEVQLAGALVDHSPGHVTQVLVLVRIPC